MFEGVVPFRRGLRKLRPSGRACSRRRRNFDHSETGRQRKSGLFRAERRNQVPFNPAKPGYAEVVLPRPLLLGSFRSACAAAKVRVPAGSPVRSMSLRLIDRNDEVFQYVSKADLSEGGEFEVVWEVKPDEFQLSWGGDANRVFDMPGRILALPSISPAARLLPT